MRAGVVSGLALEHAGKITLTAMAQGGITILSILKVV